MHTPGHIHHSPPREMHTPDANAASTSDEVAEGETATTATKGTKDG